MSCDRCAKQCERAAQAAGVPQADAEWSAGRQGAGHCRKCGGFLTEAGACNNPQCGKGGMLQAARRSVPAAVYTNLDSYIKGNRGGPVGRDIEERWQDRIEPQRMQYRGYGGAVDYLNQFGKTIGEPKARALANCAEDRGFSDMARGFWEKAYDLHRRNVRNMTTVPATVPATPAVQPPTSPSTVAGNGYCPDCGGQLRVAPGEQDWCTDCMNMVEASGEKIDLSSPSSVTQPTNPMPASQPAASPVQSTPVVSATINDYAQSARDLQDESPSDKRNAIQRKVKSVGYGAIKLALRSVGVPGGAPNENITNMVWQYLDRCDLCKAWVSPRTGVCNNPRCADKGKRVGQMRTWPPDAVRWVPYKQEVGQVVQQGQAHVISQQARQAAAGRRLENREKAKRLAQATGITPAAASPSPAPVQSASGPASPINMSRRSRPAKTDPPTDTEITEITISAEEYKKETGNETVEETITVSRKLISGKIVTYYPQTERYPYPCQARYNRAEIKIDGDGEYPHNPVVEKIKGKLADLQCLPEDHAEHCDSTKQLFESLGNAKPPNSNGKSLTDDFKDRLAQAGNKYDVTTPTGDDEIIDLIDDGRSPEAWAFQQKVKQLAVSDLPGVHPDEVLDWLGDDDEILRLIKENDDHPEDFIDRYCERYDLKRASDIL